MKNLIKNIIVICVLLHSFNSYAQEEMMEQWKNEILKTEEDFAAMVKEKGIAFAFVSFAAEDAVLKQQNKLLIGKEAIKKHFENQPTGQINLIWQPEFVDVSLSGDLGYTYGYYTLSFVNAEGKTIEDKSVFHTVWKKQPDGKWKFVWD